VPRDLELPLPLNSSELEIILVALFLLHILFVNLMVGASVLTVLFEILGQTWQKYDILAQRIGETITVNKSLAVVLGVGPMLCINLLYTTHFYSANALTGYAWISIVPLVITAFLLTYLHKYMWGHWVGKDKRYHIMLGGAAALLFLVIPLIFLANINLMLFPDKWYEVRGFFSSLQIGNVFPRYFHFLSASIALTGLFLAWWLAREKFPIEEKLPDFTRTGLRRTFYKVAFYATALQVLFGPLLLATLPGVGMSMDLLLIVSIGIVIAAFVLWILWREIKAPDTTIGKRYGWVVFAFGVLVLFMATGRHLYRESAIAEHRQLIEERTAQYKSIQMATQMRIAAGLGAGEALATGPTGESVFRNCAACHALDRVLAAPSVQEIFTLYKDNPQGIIAWAKAPGNKRREFPPMPAFGHLSDEQLQLVADYMLEIGGGDEATDDASS
jgi:cytochrome c